MKLGFLACYPEYEHKNIKYIKFSNSNTILECDMLILELEWLFNEYETSGYYLSQVIYRFQNRVFA